MELLTPLCAAAAFGLTCWISWRLVAKTGIPGVFSLLLWIPVINIVFLIYLAFTPWPVEEELARHRTLCGTLPEAEPPDDTSAPSTCAACGAAIPAGVAACPACGWTYCAPAEPPTAPPLEPPSTEKTFRDFRGF